MRSEKPTFVENWRGEAETNVTSSNLQIKFVKNGNLCNAVVDGQSSITVKNTCCFDSVMYVLSIAYKRSSCFRETLNSYSVDLIPQYIKHLSDPTSDNDININRIRSELGVLYFDTEKHQGKNYCEFACNVSFIFEKIALQYCFSAIFFKKCTIGSCQSVPVSRQIAFLPLDLNVISVFGIQRLEDAICISEEKKSCTSCNNQATCKYLLSNIVSFELNGCKEFILKDIPHYLLISTRTYSLIGATEFIPAISAAGIGHYKLHYPMNDKFFCYDDYESKIHNSTAQAKLIHCLTYCEIG